MNQKVKKNDNNSVHLFGYLNGVRMNAMENGRTAINLDVCTLEQYKDKAGEFQTRRTYHDVVIFTEDKKVIKNFQKLGKDVDANAANRGVEGYEPKTHTIAVDGILVNKENTIGGSDTKYRTLQIIAQAEGVATDVKQGEKEVRNGAMLTGNVAAIALHEDKNFAVVTIMHHYRPEGSEKDFTTTVDVRVSGDRMFSKAAYEAIKKGELKKGDFVRMGGQMHNNRFETEDGVRYGVNIDLTSYTALAKKEAKKEEVAAKPAAKKAPKKAVSKKGAVKM